MWINRVGTFGIESAAYWWCRLSSGIARAALSLLGRAYTWQLIFADDLLWTSHGPDKYLDILKVLLFWVMVGTPFSWKKVRGGLSLDWIGYWLDYSRFELGISESRAGWLI